MEITKKNTDRFYSKIYQSNYNLRAKHQTGGNTGNKHDGILWSVEEQMCKPKPIIRQRTYHLQDREGKERREKEGKKKRKKEMVSKCCGPCNFPCM